MLMIEDLEAATDVREKRLFDPYLYHAEMPFSAVYYPLGFPLKLVTNSQSVMEAAEESWGAFKPHFDIPPLRLHVGILEDGSTECPAGPVFRAQQHLIVSTAAPGNFCVSDLAKGFSFAWLSAATVAHRGYLRYHFLESAALCHIANRHSAPIHGACVEFNGSGVMLCGESGAGKSSLAFACARAGWTYITDDASFLIHGRKDRQVTGNCHMIRMRPTAAQLFPEVMGRPLTPRAAGKPSIEIATSTLGLTTANIADVDYVVYLNRAEGNSQELTELPKEAARKYMYQHLCGMEELRRSQIASVERLLTAEVIELRYRDLDWAVSRLERLVRERA
jgi:HPr Serine kinase C-terminal domain